jgi:hypothetical protein
VGLGVLTPGGIAAREKPRSLSATSLRLYPFECDHFPPTTSFWNLGFLRSGSKLGSILSQPGER